MLDQWYERYSGELTRFIRAKGFTSEDAEDICGQVFLEAVRRQPANIAPRAWLYAVANNRIIDRLRQNKRRPTAPLEEHSAVVNAPEVEQSTVSLLLLPDRQRAVIEARFFQDKSLEEVAHSLRISVGAVKALQSRALDGLARPDIPLRSVPHEREWSTIDDARLRLGIERGWNEQSLARWLGRTPVAIHVRTSRLGISRRAPTTATAREVAQVLGVGCVKTVTRWANLGWLPYHRSSDAEGATWRFLWVDVWSFLENPAYWMAWKPERITDKARRTWAIALRKGKPQWLTPGEVAKRYHVARNVVNAWVMRFGLPASRYGNWWINERDLEDWIPPYQRPRVVKNRPQPTDEPGWLTTETVAARYGVNRGQPQRWIKGGYIRGTRHGKRWWVHERDLMGWVPPRKKHPTAPSGVSGEV